MSVISWPITGVTNTFSASRSPSFTLGTAPLQNDLLIAFVASTTTSTITIPSGWRNVLSGTTDVESDTHQSCMVWHIVTAAEAGSSTVTWTLTNLYDATETGRICVGVARGIDPAGPIGNVATTFNSANSATPWNAPTCNVATYGSYTVHGISGDGTSSITIGGSQVLIAGGTATQSASLFRLNTESVAAGGAAAGTDISYTPSAGDEYIGFAITLRPYRNSQNKKIFLANKSNIYRSFI